MTRDEQLARERDRDAGIVEGRVATMEKRFDQLDAKLDRMSEQIQTWQGMQRLLLWLSAPFGAVLGWFLHQVLPK